MIIDCPRLRSIKHLLEKFGKKITFRELELTVYNKVKIKDLSPAKALQTYMPYFSPKNNPQILSQTPKGSTITTMKCYQVHVNSTLYFNIVPVKS